MTRRRLLLLLLVILALLQVRLWTGTGSWEQIASLRRDIAVQNETNNELRLRNERLYGEVRSLKHDLDSIEERARNDMGLIKSGETFYLIVDE
ncbi:Cell division protein FtsB [Zhongshania aliphaticivorans]|uniref:Cell division protein FtsB n=1 Tax=Zhongshania aliphaticivorans TaxID=1470434 RepID=A0A5S9P2H5_9GAMM|nr:cell division protein FtsB [Zhongshania aliphaticivorans]CAA0090135.1 Cell division protein FtsB [Zhongshania aliphaticivorans]CAA0097473.1 Cell division protein FtsB [Zhongshania aliphaticivorans]